MSGNAGADPFPAVKREIQEKVNRLQQEYTRWSAMMLSNPARMGLEMKVVNTSKELKRTLVAMDRSVDKAEANPERFQLDTRELSNRRQWIQDTRAHVEQIQRSVEHAEQGFTAVAIPGNAGMDEEVGVARQQEQVMLEQQNQYLDQIAEAAGRVGQMGLAMGNELRDQERLLEHVDRDTEGVMGRLSAARHKLDEVMKKMSMRTQLCIIAILTVILIVMLLFTFS